jgi:predicted HTH transcriptional regulator
MTRDEVSREIAGDAVARGLLPSFDMSPVPGVDATMLDERLVASYVDHIRDIRPGSQIHRLPADDLLKSIGALALGEDGLWHPTPVGLLFFCHDPQRILPQSSVEFMHLWGPDLTSLGMDGSRWRLNRELRGTLPEIIDQAESLLLERVVTRGHRIFSTP